MQVFHCYFKIILFPFASSAYTFMYEYMNIDDFNDNSMITIHQLRAIISTAARDVLSRLLDKSPERRITLEELRTHRWVANSTHPLIPGEMNCGQTLIITDEDVETSVTAVNSRIQPSAVRLFISGKTSRKNDFWGLSCHSPCLPNPPSPHFSKSPHICIYQSYLHLHTFYAS